MGMDNARVGRFIDDHRNRSCLRPQTALKDFRGFMNDNKTSTLKSRAWFTPIWVVPIALLILVIFYACMR